MKDDKVIVSVNEQCDSDTWKMNVEMPIQLSVGKNPLDLDLNENNIPLDDRVIQLVNESPVIVE